MNWYTKWQINRLKCKAKSPREWPWSGNRMINWRSYSYPVVATYSHSFGISKPRRSSLKDLQLSCYLTPDWREWTSQGALP